VDYYVAYDNEKVGELQGQALLDGMKARFPSAKTYNIELFSGASTDPNAAVFFNGAMKILQPKIDDGTLKVLSGQTAIGQTQTTGWLAANAQTRMDNLLTKVVQDRDAQRRPVPERHPRPCDHHLDPQRWQGQAGSAGCHRSGLRGGLDPADHVWRAVLDH